MYSVVVLNDSFEFKHFKTILFEDFSFLNRSTFPECVTIQISPDERLVACGYTDGSMKILLLPNLLLVIHDQIFNEQISSVKWRKDSKTLFAASISGVIKFFFVDSKLKILHTIQETNVINTIDLSQDNLQFATAGNDASIRIYDYNTRSIIRTFNSLDDASGHSNRVFCVKYSTYQPNLLATGGWSKEIIFYDLRESKFYVNYKKGHYQHLYMELMFVEIQLTFIAIQC